MDKTSMPKYMHLNEYIKKFIKDGELKTGEKIYSENQLQTDLK